jgi:NitT/TauT family transport system ATP-binding protein
VNGGSDEVTGRPPVVIDARNVSHRFDGKLVIDDVSLTVRKGEFVSIVGPTGCGKTTLLCILGGLEDIQEGSARISGRPPQAGRQGEAYAFPRDALLPWRTALGNVALPLVLAGVDRQERRRRAAEALDRVGLHEHHQSFRAELSQGMRQRVALARTLVSEPQVLFMDEPFAALDAQTRVLMQRELLDLLRDREATVVFITHDLDEAIVLSDTVVVLSQRPCRVLRRVHVPFPRPREAEKLRTDDRYQAIYAELWGALRDEVSETFRRGG